MNNDNKYSSHNLHQVQKAHYRQKEYGDGHRRLHRNTALP